MWVISFRKHVFSFPLEMFSAHSSWATGSLCGNSPATVKYWHLLQGWGPSLQFKYGLWLIMNCDPCSDLHSPSTSTLWSSNFRSCELFVHMTYPQSRDHFFQTHWWNVLLHFIPVFVFLCSNCLTSSSQRFWLEEDTESFVLYYFCLSNDNECPWRRGDVS